MSVSEVHWFSTASTRNPDRSSLIQFWMHETISLSCRCAAAVSKVASVRASSSATLFRRSGMLSSVPGAWRVPSAAKRCRRSWASETPLQHR
jgi:hypothetical protein